MDAKKTHAKLISSSRRQILDLVESAYGDTYQWPMIRAKILKVFGRDGLEMLIQADLPCPLCKQQSRGNENEKD